MLLAALTGFVSEVGVTMLLLRYRLLCIAVPRQSADPVVSWIGGRAPDGLHQSCPAASPVSPHACPSGRSTFQRLDPQNVWMRICLGAVEVMPGMGNPGGDTATASRAYVQCPGLMIWVSGHNYVPCSRGDGDHHLATSQPSALLSYLVWDGEALARRAGDLTPGVRQVRVPSPRGIRSRARMPTCRGPHNGCVFVIPADVSYAFASGAQ